MKWIQQELSREEAKDMINFQDGRKWYRIIPCQGLTPSKSLESMLHNRTESNIPWQFANMPCISVGDILMFSLPCGTALSCHEKCSDWLNLSSQSGNSHKCIDFVDEFYSYQFISPSAVHWFIHPLFLYPFHFDQSKALGRK